MMHFIVEFEVRDNRHMVDELLQTPTYNSYVSIIAASDLIEADAIFNKWARFQFTDPSQYVYSKNIHAIDDGTESCLLYNNYNE